MRPLWSYGVFDNSPIETALTVGRVILLVPFQRRARGERGDARRFSTGASRLGGAAAGRTMVRSTSRPCNSFYALIFAIRRDDGARAVGATDDDAR